MSESPAQRSSRRASWVAVAVISGAGIIATPVLYARSPAAGAPPLTASPVPTPFSALQVHAHPPLQPDTAYSSSDNEAAARAEAARVFALLSVPPGAVRAAGVVAGSALSAPCLGQMTSTHVSRTAFYDIPQAAATVQDWMAAHPPPGLAQQGFSSVESGSNGTVTCIEFTGVATDAYEEPEAVAALAADGSGGTALRLDVDVTWLPGKSPLEVIAPRSTPLTLVARYDVGLGRVTTIASVSLSAAQAEQLVSDIDSLPAIAQGEPFECGNDTGYRAMLSVTGLDGNRETFTYWPACFVVLVSSTGAQLPALQASGVLGDDIAQWVGAPPP